jgi:hypothetical protein
VCVASLVREHLGVATHRLTPLEGPLKILDDRSRLFGIVNPVDLVAVIALIAVALVVANVLFGVKAPTVRSSSGTVRATIFAGALRGWVPDSIKIGDPMNRKGGAAMGKVVAVKTAPSINEIPTATGMLNETRSKIFTDVYITIEGPGNITATSANIQDEQVRSNQEIDIQTPMFEATRAKINGIEKAR